MRRKDINHMITQTKGVGSQCPGEAQMTKSESRLTRPQRALNNKQPLGVLTVSLEKLLCLLDGEKLGGGSECSIWRGAV